RVAVRRCGAAAGSASGLALAACLYGFAGGGLPNIKTVAILPFDNQTPEPALTKEVNDAVLEAFQGRLGLRPAAEANADAVVRGRVVRYESDVPLSFQPGQRPDVTRRQVQITVDVEVFDQRDNKSLWQKQDLTVVGEYPRPQETAGRRMQATAQDLGLPDQAQNVRIVRRASPREIAIEAQYSETIHLPLFTHTFTFHPKATQPL